MNQEILQRAAESGVGAYTARRVRNQRDVIRDVLLAAAGCDTWLTLEELRAVTKYGAASISAQMRHLRKPEFGGFRIAKRRRNGPGMSKMKPALDGHYTVCWEYRIFIDPDAVRMMFKEAAGILSRTQEI